MCILEACTPGVLFFYEECPSVLLRLFVVCCFCVFFMLVRRLWLFFLPFLFFPPASIQDYGRRLQRLRSLRDIFEEYATVSTDDVGKLMTCGDFLRAMVSSRALFFFSSLWPKIYSPFYADIGVQTGINVSVQQSGKFDHSGRK